MFMIGKYAFLSNYYPCKVPYEGIWYSNSEAAFQAQKEKSPRRRKLYREAPPNIAKQMGRRAELREGWEIIKDKIMYEVVKAKFQHNSQLRQQLLEVTEPIVEDNTWNDTYWGKCNGKGANKLGEILERVRDEFMEQER